MLYSFIRILKYRNFVAKRCKNLGSSKHAISTTICTIDAFCIDSWVIVILIVEVNASY